MGNKPTFITLSEALFWLAFGKEYKKKTLTTHLAENNYSEDCKEKLDNARVALLAKARGALIDLEGKKTTSEPTTANFNALTMKIAPTELADFAAFDVTTDGLRYGQGLLWLPTRSENGFYHTHSTPFKRPEHYVDVHVSYSQLKKELQRGCPSKPALSDADLNNWWDSLSEEEKQLSEKAHKQMLTGSFPNKHVARARLREARNTQPRQRGRPKIAKK